MSSGTRGVKKSFANPIGAGQAMSCWDENGPTSYATGGYQVSGVSGSTSLNALGLRGFYYVSGGVDITGTYYVALYLTSHSSKPVQTMQVVWYTLSGMTQVSNGTNLSAFYAPCMAIGG